MTTTKNSIIDAENYKPDFEPVSSNGFRTKDAKVINLGDETKYKQFKTLFKVRK
jgi:hypothetical protein